MIFPLFFFNIKTGTHPGACGQSGWCYYRGFCYQLNQWPATFNNAHLYCWHQNAHLVDIIDSQENNYVANLSPPADVDIWIGLMDRGSNGRWVWINGNRKVAPISPHWQLPKWLPITVTRSKERCAFMLRRFGTNHWVAARCKRKKLFVCKRGQSLDVFFVVCESDPTERTSWSRNFKS